VTEQLSNRGSDGLDDADAMGDGAPEPNAMESNSCGAPGCTPARLSLVTAGHRQVIAHDIAIAIIDVCVQKPARMRASI
jgi:hypothetical protein